MNDADKHDAHWAAWDQHQYDEADKATMAYRDWAGLIYTLEMLEKELEKFQGYAGVNKIRHDLLWLAQNTSDFSGARKKEKEQGDGYVFYDEW